MFRKTLVWTEKVYDRFFLKSPKDGSLHIILYNTFADETSIWLKGRIIRNEPVRPQTTSLLGTIRANYSRINSLEVANVKIVLQHATASVEAKSDEEGYFTAKLPSIPAPVIKAELVHAPFKVNNLYYTHCKIIQPALGETIGVISDIDDTAIITDSHKPSRMLKKVLLDAAYKRRAVKGVPEWYEALRKGKKNTENRPFFYVSSSPWNLYDLIIEIFRLQGLPEGSLFLRDYGIDADKMLVGEHHGHKQTAITHILESFPNMTFILSGDTAQEDPSIYFEIAQKYPQRIKAIFIRDVGIPQKALAASTLAQNALQLGVPFYIFQKTNEAMAHCIEWLDWK